MGFGVWSSACHLFPCSVPSPWPWAAPQPWRAFGHILLIPLALNPAPAQPSSHGWAEPSPVPAAWCDTMPANGTRQLSPNPSLQLAHVTAGLSPAPGCPWGPPGAAGEMNPGG